MTFLNSSDSPTQQRRRRPRSAAVTTAAIFSIFVSAQANVIVQPPDLPVHSPSDPIQSNSLKQHLPVEYYPPPPESGVVVLPHLSKSHANVKPNIKKKQNKKSHEPHSPWHTMRSTNKPQVILRPRPSYSSSSTPSETSVNGKAIYYYDPSSLLTSEQESPTLTLPEVIYDADGNIKRLEEIHDGGRTEVFLEVKPKAVWGQNGPNLSSINGQIADITGRVNEKLEAESDQLIVFATIATMALLVGMLSARRLRSKRLLEDCMGEDEDWEEEKKSEGGAPSGGKMRRDGPYGPVMGEKRESFGGSLHWRGDLEKFDV